jgi:hypothetical protein
MSLFSPTAQRRGLLEQMLQSPAACARVRNRRGEDT